MSLNFKAIFDAHAASNQKTWQHDRSKTVGASESFQCIRRTYYTKTGAAHDASFDESYGATTRGSLLEAHYVVPALLAQLPKGATLLWAGDDQVTLVKDNISATPDGLITGLPNDALKDYGIDDIVTGEILIEIKSFDSRLDLKEPKPIHVGQTQQQMGLVIETTNHRPEYTVILYINASWVDDIRPFVVKRDPAVYESAKRRADKVYEASDAKDLPAEGKIRGGSECDYCPFQKQCHQAQLGSLPPEDSRKSSFGAAEDAELTALLTKAKQLDKDAARIKREASEADEAIKAFLRREGVRFGKVASGYSVSWSTAKGRKALNKEKLVEDTGIDLEDYMIEGERSERLTIRAPKE